MSADFFVIFQNEIVMNGKNCNLPDAISRLVTTAFDISFEDKTPSSKFKNFCSQISDDGNVQHNYSLKFGCFTKYKGGWVLEEEYESMNAMWEDMQSWSMSSFIDFYYRPYVLVESQEIDDKFYDTLWESQI